MNKSKVIFFAILSLLIFASCRGDRDDSSEGNICGGLIPGNGCNGNTFCQFEFGTCGAADQTGFCVAKSEICAEIYAPVCGCDGITYGNQCNADGVGISIVADGPCPK